MTRLYRDPVHGDILLSDLATRLLDTPQFQRLGRIMQLGFAHLVFRGATHTRFAHSVGTYWMSREIIRHVRQNHERLALPLPASPWWSAKGQGGGTCSPGFEALSEVVSIAGLLHDITHIPFGHTLEDELQDFYLKHDALESPRLRSLLFDPRSELAAIFQQPEPHVAGIDNSTLRWLIYLILSFRQRPDASPPQSFEDLLVAARNRCAAAGAGGEQEATDGNGGATGDNEDAGRRQSVAFFDQAIEQYRRLSSQGLFQPFMADIVSGDVAADFLDYTARDVAFTGLRAAFDPRVLHYYFIAQDAPGAMLRLALDVLNPRGYVRIDIATEIMTLMRLRYLMAERVYYHKNKVAASAMLARGLVGHGVPRDSNPFDDPESVLQPMMGDEEMIRRLACAAGAEERPTVAGSADAGAFSGRQARELGGMIYSRQLYVPALILTAEAAREAGGVGRFVDYFRGADGGRQRLIDLQNELSALGGLGSHGVLVYCPPFKMQAKAISVPVRFGRQGTVALSHHPEFADEAELLNRRYQELWKAFVFVHPDLLGKAGMAQRIAALLARRLNIKESIIRRTMAVNPGGQYTEDDVG